VPPQAGIRLASQSDIDDLNSQRFCRWREGEIWTPATW